MYFRKQFLFISWLLKYYKVLWVFYLSNFTSSWLLVVQEDSNLVYFTSHLLADTTYNKICWCVKPWPLGKEKLPALLSVTKINYVYTQCIHKFKLLLHPIVGSIFTRRKCKTEKAYQKSNLIFRICYIITAVCFTELLFLL